MRLFAALDLPEAARAAILERAGPRRAALPPASWVTAENLHLTLVFFGDVAPARVTPLAEALRAAAAAGPPLDLRLGAAGAFPERGPVRLVWIALEPAAALARLAGRLRAAAAAIKIPFDAKPFVSHVTLARCRRPWPAARREELGPLAPDPPPAFRAGGATLMASELAPGGARYHALAALPFAEAA